MKSYDHKAIERKWQGIWEQEGAFHASDDKSQPKFYALIEFPLPIRAGIACRSPEAVHGVGHRRAQTPDAGVQCTLSHWLGCIWPADGELCH